MKVLAYLIISIVLSGAIGYAIAYSTLTPQLNTLQINFKDLEVKNEYLSNEKSALLQNNVNLQNNYNSLQQDKQILQSKYNQLETENTRNIGYLKSLTTSVLNLDKTMNSLVRVEDSFSRTLNNDEIKKTSTIMDTLVNRNMDSWTARDKIYNYITANIKGCSDTEYPYISNWNRIYLDGSYIWTEFNVATARNYIQTPEFTLENKQGDCDDQSTLEYAMIMYYYRYVSGTVYTTYIALVHFGSESSHIAVFLPVQGGKLCILDAPGKYKTNNLGSTTSKEPFSELGAYNSYWTNLGYPSISKITLYSIDTTDGSYRLSAEGTVSEITKFLTG